MKPENKRNIRNLFASLISNEAAIDGAKNSPWWIAVILFIVGTFLPIIPIMTTQSKTYGASFVSGYKYDYDQALVSCGVALKAQKYEFKVEEKNLIGKVDGVTLENTWFDDKDLTPIYSYDATVNGVTHRVLNVYYSDRPYTSKAKNGITDMIKALDLNYLGLDSTDKYNAEVHSGYYIPSYLILYKTGLYSKIFKFRTKVAASATYTGLNWNHSQFNELLTYTTTTNVQQNLKDINYVNASFENWKNVFNRSYLDQKLSNFWTTSGMYWGICVGLGIFMGFMMWLLTRGKRNPNRGLNIWVTIKISWWIDTAPGILGMVLGFIWPAAAGIGYIALMGLRTMWLSMRQLNPVVE